MKMIPITAMGIMTTTIMDIMIMMTSTGIMATAMEIIMVIITAEAIMVEAIMAADTIIDLRGNCKTPFGLKSVLSSSVLKSSNLDREASFAIPSLLDLFHNFIHPAKSFFFHWFLSHSLAESLRVDSFVRSETANSF